MSRLIRAVPRLPGPRTLRADVTASLVVFLVALPLCVGVAVASGVPAEVGLVTGIVGGLVAGLLPGSSLQVSGPAAGLTVLVYEAIQEFGLPSLGALVLCAGGLQIAMGALRLGRWFRAISLAVVQGMLAGIGLVLIADSSTRSPTPRRRPAARRRSSGCQAWSRAPSPPRGAHRVRRRRRHHRGARPVAAHPARGAPAAGPLAAVAMGTGAAALFDLPVHRVEVAGLLDVIQPPGAEQFAAVAGLSGIGTVLAFALIASAESLFSAAAVDRLHDGPRTDYDRELIAQGAGNTVCGALGALPMTAVIVRSAANVQAGARTKAARVLHGVWLLLFAALLPGALGVIPVAALAGVLVHAGWKLVPVKEIAPLWREHRGEAVVLIVTATGIVTTNMFEGVLIGLLTAVVKTAWETSQTHVDIHDTGEGPIVVRVLGNATFLRLPKLLEQLEALPRDRPLELDLRRLRHLDHACGMALLGWAERHNEEGVTPVRVQGAPV